MGRFLVGILAITIASAQPVPVLGLGSDNSGYTWFGPKTVYPGFSHYYTFPRTSWMVPVACAASGNTCDTAGSACHSNRKRSRRYRYRRHRSHGDGHIW